MDRNARAERLRWFTREVKKHTKRVRDIQRLMDDLRANLAALLKSPVVSLPAYRDLEQAIDLNARNLVAARVELTNARGALEAETIGAKLDQQKGLLVPFPKVNDGR